MELKILLPFKQIEIAVYRKSNFVPVADYIWIQAFNWQYVVF